MKENKVDVYTNEGKNKINQISDDMRLTNEDKKVEGYNIFKNRMKALFNEFGHDEINNLNVKSSSAINFSEKELNLKDGCFFLIINLIIMIICILLIVVFSIVGKACYYLIPIPALGLIVCCILICCNFMTISPGYALVLTYYGKYLGTCKKPGYYWIRPCTDKSLISLKSLQFNGNMIKVNDKDGTPVLIGVVSVYHISDTVKATYGVSNSHEFMKAQTESAIRFIANKFCYDSN